MRENSRSTIRCRNTSFGSVKVGIESFDENKGRRSVGVLHQARDEPHLRDHGHARRAESLARHRHIILNATPNAEKAEFLRLRKEQGLKAALAWRDARFSDGKA